MSSVKVLYGYDDDLGSTSAEASANDDYQTHHVTNTTIDSVSDIRFGKKMFSHCWRNYPLHQTINLEVLIVAKTKIIILTSSVTDA